MKSLHSYRGYPFTIEEDSKESYFGVDYPDIPRIITSGSTLAEAFANACEALDLYLEALKEEGLPTPKVKRRLILQSVRTRATNKARRANKSLQLA